MRGCRCRSPGLDGFLNMVHLLNLRCPSLLGMILPSLEGIAAVDAHHGREHVRHHPHGVISAGMEEAGLA